MNDPGPKSSEPIPSVDFYGKDERWPTLERLHSEPLVDRSAQHNWIIRAHRHSNQVQIFLLLEGSGIARLDSVRYEASSPGLIVVPERCVHEFHWSSECHGYVLSIASSLLAELKQRSVLFGDVFSTAASYDLAHDKLLGPIFERIHTEYELDRPLRELALESRLTELAIALVRIAGAGADNLPRTGRGARHYRRFEILVERHHKIQWPVARYAAALGITAPHLNAICRQYDGRSAKQVIRDRLLLAARRGLAYTDVSVAGIARSLGFSDPSYFTRYFRRAEGMTPSQFRRRTGTQSAAGR